MAARIEDEREWTFAVEGGFDNYVPININGHNRFSGHYRGVIGNGRLIKCVFRDLGVSAILRNLQEINVAPSGQRFP